MFTDIINNGDRLLVEVPPIYPQYNNERQCLVFTVTDIINNKVSPIHDGWGHRIHKTYNINRRANGRVYIGRHPVIARVN
jgi:hypothetical protein